MKIIVLNGSPKGDTSITMQYVRYLQENFAKHEFEIVNISFRIKKIEKNEKFFQEILEKIKSSDCVLWAFPLYFCLVPAQYKRFIELVFLADNKVFANKYSAVLTTSIHFYDHTAHNYMNAICDDLDMNFAGSFSAGMHDLLKKSGRQKLMQFGDDLFESIENKRVFPKNYFPISHSDFQYLPTSQKDKIDFGDKKVLVLSDSNDENTNLGKMITSFTQTFKGQIKVVDLHDIKINGGCLGCIKCGYDNKCSYGDSDDFVSFFYNEVKQADVLIFAGTIKDRYLSAKWKEFMDRSFYNNHVPVLNNKQIGYLISGSLAQIANLRQILEAYPEWQGGNMAGIITDECEDSNLLDRLLFDFAERLIRFSDQQFKKPYTFLSIAGRKIFRDDVWGNLRFVFQADHKYFKSHGFYDFPQYKWKQRFQTWFMMLLTKVPVIRKDIYKKMKHHMIAPFKGLFASKKD